MSLYDHPEIYATLLYPEPELLQALLEWIDEHLEGPLRSALDPACGPATWLLPLAARDVFVAGNDLNPRMVEEAEKRLEGFPAEVVAGDMRTLKLKSAPFDLALNLHASIGHLATLDDALKHLKSVYAQLRPGGIYLIGLCVFDGEEVDESTLLLYQSEPMELPSGGTAAIRYESRRRDPVSNQEEIHLMLLTKDVAGCDPIVEESYTLQSFQRDALMKLIADSGFELVTAYAMDEDDAEMDYPESQLEPDCGDLTVVLRRPNR